MVDKLLEVKRKQQEFLATGNKEGIKRLEDVLHQRSGGAYLRDVFFGANDGIVTTFAVIAAGAGAMLSPLVIIIMGIANLVGDGISMGLGNYLGMKSETDYHKKLRRQEYWEMKHLPEIEREEIRDIFKKMGFKGPDLDRATEIVTSNPEVWVDTMMKLELGVMEEHAGSPRKHGLIMFVSFVIAGFVPLIPYFLPDLGINRFYLSTGFAMIMLFVTGSFRSRFSAQHWSLAGLEMLIVGTLCGGAAYGLGYGLDLWLS